MQIEYVAPPHGLFHEFREVQSDEGSDAAVELVWEKGLWMGMEIAFQKIRDAADAWREDIV